MTSAHLDGQATAAGDTNTIVPHRDLPLRFRKLAGLLHHGMRFDSLTLFLHDAARSAPRAALTAPKGAPRPDATEMSPETETA